MALDVDPADRVGERAAGRLDRAALARALLLLAGEDAAVEGEAQIVIGLRQHGGEAGGGVEGEPVLPDLERLARDQSGDAADRLGVPGDDPVLAGELGGVEEGAPVDPRRAVANSARRPALDGVRVLRGDGVGMGAGDPGLEIEDARPPAPRHRACRSAAASGDIGAVAVADAGHRRRVGEIIIAVGKAEAALQQIGAGCGPAPAGPARRTRRTDSRCRRWSRSADRRRRACSRRARRRAGGGRRSRAMRARCGCSGASPRASIIARSR